MFLFNILKNGVLKTALRNSVVDQSNKTSTNCWSLVAHWEIIINWLSKKNTLFGTWTIITINHIHGYSANQDLIPTILFTDHPKLSNLKLLKQKHE